VVGLGAEQAPLLHAPRRATVKRRLRLTRTGRRRCSWAASATRSMRLPVCAAKARPAPNRTTLHSGGLLAHALRTDPHAAARPHSALAMGHSHPPREAIELLHCALEMVRSPECSQRPNDWAQAPSEPPAPDFARRRPRRQLGPRAARRGEAARYSWCTPQRAQTNRRERGVQSTTGLRAAPLTRPRLEGERAPRRSNQQKLPPTDRHVRSHETGGGVRIALEAERDGGQNAAVKVAPRRTAAKRRVRLVIPCAHWRDRLIVIRRRSASSADRAASCALEAMRMTRITSGICV
jgi:hypothetical protein